MVETVMSGEASFARAGWKEDATDGRILQLSSWMMILGTVRLVCAVGDYLNEAVSVAGRSRITLSFVSRFLQEHPPAILLGLAWPLLLGLILRRTRSRVFVRASALTFLILSLGGLATLLSGIVFRSEEVIFGSIGVSRWGFLRPQPAAVFRALFGLIQLGLEFMTACLAMGLPRSMEEEQSPGAVRLIGGSRRKLQGRLCVYVTLAFLVLSCRQMAWSTYLAVLNKSAIFRAFVLQNDQLRRPVPSSALVSVRPTSPAARMAFQLGDANAFAANARYAEATRAYINVIDEIEARKAEGGDIGPVKGTLATALNNLAWLLATCEDAKQRRPSDSVAYARRALALDPDQGTYWNTLGAAYYRMKEWDQAVKALERSMELREGQGDAFDWYFLAMIHASQGRKDRAMPWYEKAVAWSGERPADPELYRFQVEAAEQLSIEKPPMPETLHRKQDDRRAISRPMRKNLILMPKSLQ
ncbi:MAG: tetratricopeptide repeat protein [Isosphaeraceae bacterium]